MVRVKVALWDTAAQADGIDVAGDIDNIGGGAVSPSNTEPRVPAIS